MAITVTISGATVTVLEQSVTTRDTNDGRSVASFTVKDTTGAADYQPGQPVTIVDSVGSYTYTGYVNDTQKTNLTPQTTNLITVNCIDGRYIADKRYYAGPEYQNRYAGDIVVDLLTNALATEGLTAFYASRNDRNQASWAAGSLNSVTATNNVPGGDLELAPAGSTVSILENTTASFSTGSLNSVTAANNTLAPTATNAIKITGTQSVPGAGNSYTYVKVWAGSQSVGANNFLDYDIWVDPACPEVKIGVDMVFSDGTTWRDTATFNDVQNQPPHPATDLKGLADGTWYHRDFFLSNYNGKTISYVTVAIEGDKAGTYTGWIKNIAYTDVSRNPITNFFSGTLQTSQQMQTNGYSGVTVSVVPTYNLVGSFRNSTAYSVDAVKLLRSSFLSWQATTPTNTQVVVKYSLDTWNNIFITCTNNAPLPGLPAGTNLAGRTLTFSEQFTYTPGGTPEQAPVISLVELTLNPSYTATKSDVIFQCGDTTAWNQAGTTLTNTTAPGKTLTLLGSVRNFDDGSNASQTTYGNGTPVQVVTNKAFTLQCNASSETRSRLDFAGQYADFTFEADIIVNASIYHSVVYRTTGWQNNDSTWAYSVEVGNGGINLNKGTNSSSGAGGASSVATVTFSLTAGNWHHLKIIVSGSNHKVYLDDVLEINATDATYSAAGYIGLRNRNFSGSTQIASFDNVGVIATNAMTGTWLSPNVSLTGAATYGNSVISWRDQSTNPSNSTLKIEASINGGSTWQTCTSGSAIPNFSAGQSLSGVNLNLRITLTSTTASTLPGLDNLLVLVTGGFSSSGSRIAPALSLAPVGRAGSSLVAWTGTQPTSTTIAVDTSLDATTWTQAGTGASGTASIAGITTQTEPLVDGFTSNTSLSYTSLNQTGGSLATWTWDTANSRLEVSGGTNAVLIYNSTTTGADCDIAILTDLSDGGGLCWRYQNQSNYYDLAIHDASSSSHASTLRLFKVVAGTRTQIGSDTAIMFTRGTPHIIRVVVLSNNITVYFDGSVTIGTIDSSYTGAGFTGLRNNGNSAQVYMFRQQFYGDDVTAKTVYSRVRLTSTDPAATPEVTQLTVSCRNASIQNGVFVPQTAYSLLSGNKFTVAGIIEDLAKQSNFWTRNTSSQVYFQAHTAMLAPFAIYLKDVQVLNASQENQNDAYRNSEWVTGGIDAISLSQTFIGDGTRTSFTLAYPVDSISSITLGSTTQTYGIKNTSTGKQWYYPQGDPTIVQDTSGSPILGTQSLMVAYSGQVPINTNVRNDAEIARVASLDNTSGIIEEVDDGAGMTKAAMIARANGLLTQFAVAGKKAKFTTMRSGLAVGQLISVFVSPLGQKDGTFLVTEIDTSWVSTSVNGVSVIQPFYNVTGIYGPVVGAWTRFIGNLAVLA